PPPWRGARFTVWVVGEDASGPPEPLTAEAVDAFTALLEPWGLASAMLVGGAGAPVSFVTVVVVGSDMPYEFSDVTVTVIGPSISAWPLTPVKWRIPDPDVPKSRAVWSWS